MTGPAFLLLTIALAIAVVDWIAVQNDRRPVEYVAKPLTMVALVGVALAVHPYDDTVRLWFVAALVLSLAGDVFLMLPRDLFVAGLASFLLAHVAYVVGMQIDGVDLVPFLVGVLVVAAALAVIGTIVLKAVRAGDDPALAGPVVAYMVVISAMVATAVGTGRWLAVLGASLFYVSDALIAWDRFVSDVARARLLIMVTYHLGQMGLVLSLAGG
jgi:uncharacterized membrane protein YhhN